MSYYFYTVFYIFLTVIEVKNAFYFQKYIRTIKRLRMKLIICFRTHHIGLYVGLSVIYICKYRLKLIKNPTALINNTGHFS